MIARSGIRARTLGARLPVPLLPRGEAGYCLLDYAASAPPLESVAEAVSSFLPYYSSVHRGAGFKSQVASAAYEGARETIARFLNARPDDAVIITRNTTDSINLIARCLPPELGVVVFEIEHHANLLPWRRRHVRQLPVPTSPDAMLTALEAELAGRPAGLVAATGASNVTGELTPLAELAAIAHRHGARLLVDAAQLAPHRAIDMTILDVDYLVFSGHKVYAPYGAGVIVGRPDWLNAAEPYLAGGGAVEFVTHDDVLWKSGFERHEAGSPNVLGALAMGAACAALSAIGMDTVAAHETELVEYARPRLLKVPGLHLYSTWSFDHPHIGVLSFNLGDLHHSLVASVLSAEHGIGVRDGCFCAHPLMLHTLCVDGASADHIRDDIKSGHRLTVPGAVRASFGLDSTIEDVDRLVAALTEIGTNGPQWTYKADEAGGAYAPDPDPRRWPALSPLIRLSA